jgi:hypothetical protein
MGKQLKDLKKGDKIWFVQPYYKHWEGYTTKTPKIYEATIDEDSSPQSSLPFPEYCMVHYYCPELNSNHMNSSEHGENEQGHNGHLFFTDYNECVDYVMDLRKKNLEYAERKLEQLTKDVEELKASLA